MTPQEKAIELVDKYSMITKWKMGVEQEYVIKKAKECALIAVNEIIDAIDWHEYETPNKELNYWLDIRKEIEKL